jgi:4,5-dihydroxyphthalate decarboxylase
MADIRLTIGCGAYDRTEPLRDGRVKVEGVELTYIPIQLPPEIFSRTLRGAEFHIAEMSMATYFTSVASGDFPFIALPIFPCRFFRHGNIFINTKSGIRTPKDLEGKKIGTLGYGQSAACWIRGILSEEYGVDLNTIRWIEGGLESAWQGDASRHAHMAHIKTERAPDHASLSELLASGELDAFIGARRPSCYGKAGDVKMLFENFRETERSYYKKTGIFPIMHNIVIRKDLLQDYPWLGTSLFKAFEAAKDISNGDMRFTGTMKYGLPWLFDEIDEVDSLFNGEAYPNGLEENRHVIETFCRYLLEQGLIKEKIDVDKYFVPIFGEK